MKRMTMLVICYGATLWSAEREQLAVVVQSHADRAHVGCVVANTVDGNIVYEYNSEKLFTPASVTKLFTGAAALHLLGHDFTYTTELLEHEGNLIIRAAGDPTLTSAQLGDLVRAAREKGIKTIKNIIVDTTVFDTQAYAPGTSTDDIGTIYLIPTLGLILDRKALVLQATDYCPASVTMTGNQLADLFRANGIEVEGAVVMGAAPAEATLMVNHTSRSLCDLLVQMEQMSDNLYADCICKTIGKVSSKSPGSWANGVAAVTAYARDVLGVALHDTALRDGSGMSRYNLISPRSVMQLLLAMRKHPSYQHFMSALPQSGRSGTLLKRMTDKEGRVVAKTGTLGGVTALAGYIKTGSEPEYAFSVLTNHYGAQSHWPNYKTELEDAVCRTLAVEQAA